MSEAENARWYVVHTYSGYENKVKADIEKTKENRNLQDQILEVVVPVEDATEIKNGKPKSIERKILPGYVLINMIMNDVTWYVVHTYSGYENKVKADIEKTIENRKLQDQILEVSVPVEETIEVRNGVQKAVQRKMFPGYVLLNMIMNDATWYVVRNTRGVTGFVGPGSKPVPLSDEEMKNLGINKEEIVIDAEIGDTIEVVSGAWEGTVGKIKAINTSKQTVTIDVEIFGRATSVDIAFVDIKKM